MLYFGSFQYLLLTSFYKILNARSSDLHSLLLRSVVVGFGFGFWMVSFSWYDLYVRTCDFSHQIAFCE